MKRTAQVREYFKQMGTSSCAECTRAIGFPKTTIHRCIKELVEQGWLERAPDVPGLFRFQQRSPEQLKTAELQDKLFRAIRVSRSFTAFDIAMLSSATLDYSKRYISFLMKQGLVSKAGKDGHKAVYRSTADLPGTAPRMHLKRAKREIKRQDLMDLGWAMMRAIRDGDMEEARRAHGEIGKNLQIVLEKRGAPGAR